VTSSIEGTEIYVGQPKRTYRLFCERALCDSIGIFASGESAFRNEAHDDVDAVRNAHMRDVERAAVDERGMVFAADETDELVHDAARHADGPLFCSL